MAENGKPTTSEITYLQTIQILQTRVRTLEQKTEKNHFIGKSEILEAYGWTDYQFKKLARSGLPLRNEDGTIYADRRNIDEWYKAWTRVSNKNIEVD